MNNAERNLLISRLTLVLSLGFVALIVRDLAKMQQKKEVNQLVSDLERYLHFSRIQSVIDPAQQAIIDKISETWSNENWREQQINTLNP